MKKYIHLLFSFGIMLCLGSVYAWSIFVPELRQNYGFTTTRTQLIFGVLIAAFTLTMALAGRYAGRYGSRLSAMLSALFFGSGYLMAGFSGGNFILVLLGIGIFGGIGTGFGYLVAITTSVKWFPTRSGMAAGIAAAGFGLGAIVLSWFSNRLLMDGIGVSHIFRITGLSYGGVMFVLSVFLKHPPERPADTNQRQFSLAGKGFARLFAGIFCGTFAGLLVIGNLKPIGEDYAIDNKTLLLGIAAFSFANFAGRLVWGWLSDYLPGRVVISVALSTLGVVVFLLGRIPLSAASYLILSVAIGFGFGANFVLFARETVQIYGVDQLGRVYPFIFLGYGLAGIFGPVTGGIIHDVFNNYSYATTGAALISLAGAALFLFTGQKQPSDSSKNGITKPS